MEEQLRKEQAAVKRINRLLPAWERVRKTRERWISELGEYHVLDISRNIPNMVDVDLDELEADLRRQRQVEVTDSQLRRKRLNEVFCQQFADQQLQKWGLAKQGRTLYIPSFYEQDLYGGENECGLLGCCDHRRKKIVIFPRTLIKEQTCCRETLLHEISHALSPDDHEHGEGFLEACCKVMPRYQSVKEHLVYSRQRQEVEKKHLPMLS